MPKDDVDKFVASNQKQNEIERQVSNVQNNNKDQVEATSTAPGDWQASTRQLSPLDKVTSQSPEVSTTEGQSSNPEPVKPCSASSPPTKPEPVLERTVTFQEPIKKPSDKDWEG